MTTVLNQMLAEFKEQFMQPEIVKDLFFLLDNGDGEEYWTNCPVGDEDGKINSIDEQGGYFARLSASGYLDCTDWSGPFDSQDDAAQHLIDTFGE